MAFDGITVSALVSELKEKLLDGRISKVAQPEKHELLLLIKAKENYRLYISANAALPLLYLTDDNKQSPVTAPAFCMLLRKHLNSARIIDIRQGDEENSLERTVDFTIEHLDEMGDVKHKHLIAELMGKHSNIIFCDEDYKIIDSIKRVSSLISSVREVLPGREYFLPKTENKGNPLELDYADFERFVLSKPEPSGKAIYTGLTGISPMCADEICMRAGVPDMVPARELDEGNRQKLFREFSILMDDVKRHVFTPVLLKRDGEVKDFAVFRPEKNGMEAEEFQSVSELLRTFYSEKNSKTLILQKSSDLRKIVTTALERESKKLDLQSSQLKDTEKRDKYKLYGELLTVYGYSAESGAKSVTVQDYYTNSDVTIPLDPEKSALENAKKYFDRYAKMKRTYEAVTVCIEETKASVEHLKSVALALQIARTENDLDQIKRELTESGYIRFHADKNGKKDRNRQAKSEPLHYVSPEGVHFYVGKNNTQNDELTFGFASNNDWWFHAKGCPGSHVIMKTDRDEMPDKAFEDAGALAAYYSSADKNGKIWVDYVKKKEVKKPANAKPGFVVYYTNYSLVAVPDISRLDLL